MSLFDSVIINYSCPYCHEISEIEFQTKDVDCEMKVYRPGDFINHEKDFINVIGDCHSEKCQDIADKFSCSFQKSSSGFGALFNAKIRIVNKIITSTVFDIKIDNCYTEEFLESIKDKWQLNYKKRKSKIKLFS